jgi:tetratricopeptide (TPR) repeat protein
MPMRTLALLATVALSAVARAESPAEVEARQHYGAAQKLFDHAQWTEALAEYQASYALSKFPAILYKIALCQDQLEQYEAAIESYQRYLDADPASDRRSAVEVRIARLRERAAPKKPPEEKPSEPPVPAPPASAAAPATSTPLSIDAPVEKPKPAYKRWWVWTLVGVGVAGVALGVGLGVGLSGSSFNANLHPVGPGL